MTGVAVIGMSGRLPGANDLDQFWDNLLAGRDCITRLPAAELRGLVPDDLLDDARWIGASGRITAPYDFDPAFFGMAPKEALVTDPQHRLLLTTVHRALEDGCVVPGAPGRVGVFTGVGRNRHEDLVRAVYAARGELVNELALEIGNEKDHSSTKVAYRLGLTGPAVSVQSACSTGLVALHQACHSLEFQECDVAVVGAAAVRVPGVYGYRYLEGSISSADGVCRPFSARASGAVAGDGVVAVVLKRLDDARADGDHVRAVIRGSAVNNDGAKTSYGAVSSQAQEQLIRDALLFAEADPETVASVEAHGSGTRLGDAIEWTALSSVYGKGSRTLVGSVKSAIGHLRESSGLAGLARAVLSVEHGVIPPTINVGFPADFVTRAESGLALARSAQPWPGHGTRRAAVSAFGLGGTNAHVIIEQPPARPVVPEPGPAALVLISAQSSAALERTADGWAAVLRKGTVPATAASAVSQLGRRHHRHRRFAVGDHPEEIAANLSATASPVTGARDPQVCFVFPGVGDQYPGMGVGLDRVLPGYADHVARLLADCGDLLGRDLRSLLGTGRPQPPGGPQSGVDLRRLIDRGGRATEGEVFDPVSSHAVLFSLQLALASGLRRLGIQPTAVTGHSLGELTAATLAGVFTEADALRVVVRRAQLVAEQPEGAMLAVSLPRAQAEELTGPGVWLSAVNSPRSCVLAGDRERVLEIAALLESQETPSRLLPVRHAFHTPMLAAAGQGLRDLLAGVRLAEWELPIAANATGTWAGPQLLDPDYWYRQLTSPVLFSDALATAASRCGVLLEIGPGQLRTLAVQAQGNLAGAVVVATMRREYQNQTDDAVLLRAVGQLWAAGCEPDWAAMPGGRGGWRSPLPPTAMDEHPTFVGEDGINLDAPLPAASAAARPAEPRPPAPSPAPAGPGPGGSLAGERPRLDGLVAVLAAAWSEVLGVDDLDVEDDFFDLGGDSLMSVQLVFGLEEQLGCHVPAVTVFEASKLGPMAEHISAWLANTKGGQGA
jgi:phthiocerol/phenolphthiocerol synthesis type-I polyketide synthase E